MDHRPLTDLGLGVFGLEYSVLHGFNVGGLSPPGPGAVKYGA